MDFNRCTTGHNCGLITCSGCFPERFQIVETTPIHPCEECGNLHIGECRRVGDEPPKENPEPEHITYQCEYCGDTLRKFNVASAVVMSITATKRVKRDTGKKNTDIIANVYKHKNGKSSKHLADKPTGTTTITSFIQIMTLNTRSDIGAKMIKQYISQANLMI